MISSTKQKALLENFSSHNSVFSSPVFAKSDQCHLVDRLGPDLSLRRHHQCQPGDLHPLHPRVGQSSCPDRCEEETGREKEKLVSHMAEITKDLTNMETIHTTDFFSFCFLNFLSSSDVSSAAVPTKIARVFVRFVCVCLFVHRRAFVCVNVYQYAVCCWVYKEKPSSVSCTHNAPLLGRSETPGYHLQQNTGPCVM